MARGRRRAPQRGTAPARRMARGGKSTGVKKYPHGGMHNNGCGGPGQMPCGGQMKRGGRTKPVRKFHQGAGINPNHSHMRNTNPNRMSRNMGTNSMYNVGGQMHTTPNKGCQMHSGDATSCNNHPSCTYNYSTGMCH